METFYMYVLQVNVGLLVFYLLYRGLLARDTFLGMRRLYWWAAWVLAFLYPLVELGVWGRTETPLQVVMADYAEAMTVVVSAVAPEETAAWSWQDGVALLWAAGASALLLRMLVQLAVVCRLARRGRKVEWHGVRVLAVEGDNVPFSFFRWIFVQPGNHSEGELEEILAHEQAHVCQWHSLDVVVSELLCCLSWFNPAVWLAKRCVRQNLEFLADRAVVHSGFDRKNYQYHLLRLSYGVNIGQIVNNFNVSPLKKRIMMMNKKKSRHAGALKYALLLPVAGLLVLSANAEAVAETAENVVAHWTADEGPVRMTGVVVDENGKPLPGVTVVIKGSMLGVATDAEGRFEIVSPEDKTLVFTYVGRKTQEVAFDGGTTDIKVVMPVEDVELNPLVAADVESILNQAADSTKDEVVSVWQDEFFKVVEDMPQFTDGNIFDYLAQHVRYPEEAEKNGIGGMVYVQFVIDTTGKVVEPKVIKSVSPELDAEALRVVSEMPAWKPGMQRGKPVRVSFTLPVIFKLPTPEGAAPDDKVQVSTMVADSICIMGNSVTGSGNPKGQAYECMLSELRSKIKETPLIFVGTQQQEAGFDLASLDPQMVEHVMLCWGTRVTYMDGQKLDNQTVVMVKMKEGR
ncbi:MAG TPA: TonB family protein [Candidatus Odoribacter faecigallinarum]|uniref:TonB family protein n=1 Tax=Candidatus Odoribacter faecigallinarum TaxID=2838706 RepID=A0A9D1V074_9BACT|nr:TonB family protein [Candidatus Odoribacter faecigallinarum]